MAVSGYQFYCPLGMGVCVSWCLQLYVHGAVNLSLGDCQGKKDYNITQWDEILEKHSYFHGVSGFGVSVVLFTLYGQKFDTWH